ncbi:hypothetical protein COLO4_35628 [Corchorus olitorius]|uniref:Uncharacterized protein n=1 Tax=Corchorus olitorius TaxID=93759 RepID=A0A1R3GEJ4_9ROSI|nr:hypothetical protein COLO4_35628 [Corchorus olitorius]
MKQIVDEIRLTDTPVDNDDLVLHVFKGVGSEFREIVAAIRLRETPLSFGQLNDLLTVHELYLRLQEIPLMDVSIPTVNFNRRVSTNSASRGYIGITIFLDFLTTRVLLPPLDLFVRSPIRLVT